MEVDIVTLTSVMAGLIVGIGSAIAYMVKLSMRINHLEKELASNPVLNALKQFEQGYLIRIISDFITNRVEKKND